MADPTPNPELSGICAGVPYLVGILKNLEDLKETPRSGEVRAGVPLGSADRISGHIFFVSTTSLLIARYLAGENITLRVRSNSQAEEVEIPAADLDLAKLLQIALVHDWGEAFLGDVDRGVKAMLEGFGTNINDLEARLLEKLLGDSPGFQPLLECHRDYEAWASPEALIVRVADLVDNAAIECRRFSGGDTRLAGTPSTPRKLNRLRSRCPQLADFFEAFEAQWPKTHRRI